MAPPRRRDFVAWRYIRAFYTLPATHIRHWRSVPTDDGQFVGDAIPVVVVPAYKDDESGPLAGAFRDQVDERDGQAPSTEERLIDGV